MRPISASSGMKLMDYWSESFSSASSSLGTDVSTISKKMGLLACWFWFGKMYSMVVKSWMSSAGSWASLMLLA